VVRRATGDRRAPGWDSPKAEALDILLTWERDMERRLMARRFLDSEGTNAFWADIERIRHEQHLH